MNKRDEGLSKIGAAPLVTVESNNFKYNGVKNLSIDPYTYPEENNFFPLLASWDDGDFDDFDDELSEQFLLNARNSLSLVKDLETKTHEEHNMEIPELEKNHKIIVPFQLNIPRYSRGSNSLRHSNHFIDNNANEIRYLRKINTRTSLLPCIPENDTIATSNWSQKILNNLC